MEFSWCWSLISRQTFLIMNNLEFNKVFRDRTMQLALNVISYVSSLQKKDSNYILSKQLIRSVTSVGANFRAVCLARSLNEKYAKYCIVVEEADETVFWLEMLRDTNKSKAPPNKIMNEADEIIKVMSTCRTRLGQKIGKQKA